MATTYKMTCPLTGKEVNYERGEYHTYNLEIGGNKVYVFLCTSCFSVIKTVATIPQHVIRGLIANNKFPDRHIFHLSERTTPHKENEIDLFSFLQTASYPKTPKEKSDNLLLNLFKMQSADGEQMMLNLNGENIWMKNYFRTVAECIFYFDALKKEDLISYNNIDVNKHAGIRFTLKGLNKAIQLTEEGNNSNKCFVAMAFDDTTKQYREAIKKALAKTDFKIIIIDEEHINSDKTIPDGILAGIRQSKFCIADFSLHRNGVYFESGFALGLGKQVIYTCKKEEFEKSHFDIKQLQHIIYETPEQLEKLLVDKIEAWIK